MSFCAEDQLHEHQYCPLSVEKVTVWCAMGRTGIIGAYQSDVADGHPPVTVNTEQCLN